MMPDSTFINEAKLVMESDKFQYIPSQIGYFISSLDIGEPTMMVAPLRDGQRRQLSV